MLRTAIKSVLSNKVRLGLTALAIVLGVSLVAGTFIFTDTITAQFDGLFDDIFEGVDVTVRKAGGEFSANEEPFPASVMADIMTVDGVEFAEGGVSTFTAQLLDKDGEPIGGQGPPTLGFSWGTVESLSPVSIKSGLGSAPMGPGQVAIDANAFNRNGFAVGDQITVVTPAGVEQFELVGVMSFGGEDTLMGATLATFELEEARRLFGYGDEFTSIALKAADGVTADELAERVATVLQDDLEAVTGETQKNEQAEEIDTALSFISIGLLAFAGVSIFVGGYIIQNTFRIIVAQRTRELALLRAVGATARQVTRTVILEAFVIGLFGSIVGIVIGFLMAIVIRWLMNFVGLALPDASLVIQPRTVVVGLAVGLILTMASAVLPARRASKVPPIAAMRADLATPVRRDLRTRTIWGTIVAGLGVLLLLLGLFLGGLDNPITLVGLGAAMLFIGVSILAPLAARPLANLLGRPAEAMSGVAGALARENTKRAPRRTASTASALMIGVALIGFFAVFASSTKASIEETLEELFPADLTIQSTNQSDPEFPAAFSSTIAEEIAALPEFGVVSPMQFGRIEIEGKELVIGAFDPATVDAAFSLKPVGDAISAAGQPDSLIVAVTKMEDKGWIVGQSVRGTFARTGDVVLTIVGTFEADDFTSYYMSTGTYRENFTTLGDGLVFANAADGVDVATAQTAAMKITDPYGSINVQTSSDLIQSAKDQINQGLLLFTGLLVIAVIIAVLGIVNTLALSVYERTREIGLLRAVGMNRPQVRQMIRWESVIIALFGAMLGVVIGIFLGWAVVQALADEGLGTFRVPYSQVALAFILAGIAGVFAAIWPARKAAKLNVLEAISYE